MQANIFPVAVTDLFSLLGQPARLQILLVLARDEACVCHIEALLGLRQAAISQHLMRLRKAGLVLSRRRGRNQFYRLSRPDLYQAICQLAIAAGVPAADLARYALRPVSGCPCPDCNPGIDPALTCKKLNSISD